LPHDPSLPFSDHGAERIIIKRMAIACEPGAFFARVPNIGPFDTFYRSHTMAVKTSKRAGEMMRAGGSASMPQVSDKVIRDLVQVFRLLSDETRLRILFYLVQNQELHVTDLCDRLGQTQPAVSHHLALLRVSGLIEARREGKHNFYSVRSDVFGELLVSLFSSTGEVPKKIKFHDFTLAYNG
jgi:ArsR family transcriptional regulator